MYKVLRIYDNCTSVYESGDDFILILGALAIYLEDPSCIGVKVWHSRNGKLIIDYWKEGK